MADQLVIQDGRVVVTTEEGRKIERSEAHLLAMLRREFVPPLDAAALPDGTKFLEWRDPVLLLVHQMSPQVRLLRWIKADSRRPFGPGTKYRQVRLSIPYAITFATYIRHGKHLFLANWNDLYFRNEPLRSLGDRLSFPALLNISRILLPKREAAWICTQHLQRTGIAGWTEQLAVLLDHTWNGAFNLSSEHHEGASWYTLSQGVHQDLHPVQRWEQATAADEAFALKVPWKPAPLTVGELMDCLLQQHDDAERVEWLAWPRPAKSRASLVHRFLNFVQGSKEHS